MDFALLYLDHEWLWVRHFEEINLSPKTVFRLFFILKLLFRINAKWPKLDKLFIFVLHVLMKKKIKTMRFPIKKDVAHKQFRMGLIELTNRAKLKKKNSNKKYLFSHADDRREMRWLMVNPTDSIELSNNYQLFINIIKASVAVRSWSSVRSFISDWPAISHVSKSQIRGLPCKQTHLFLVFNENLVVPAILYFPGTQTILVQEILWIVTC